MPLVVATANVQGSLDRDDARACLALVVGRRPDLVALQEWHPWRRRILREFDEFRWFSPWIGGCAVGASRARFAIVDRRTVHLSGPGRADRGGRVLGLEPARRAALVVADDRDARRRVAVVSYHLVSQVQGNDEYRHSDRPRLVARHRRESKALAALVSALELPTYAAGDSNFHGFRLPGLVSTWDALPTSGGTLGPRRQVDDIFAAVAPRTVELLDTPSDHRAVVATWP